MSVRIPIVVSCTLKENGKVKSHPFEPGIYTIRQCRKRVPEYYLVARIIDGIFTDIPRTVSICVQELQVSCLPASGKTSRTVTQINLLRIGGSLLVSGKETVSTEAPYLAYLHAFIVIHGKCPVRVVIPGNYTLVITEIEANIISERLSCSHELVTPVHGDLVSRSTQVGSVHVRRIGSINCRKRDSFSQHVLGITDIGVCSNIETVVEHVHINTEIPLVNFLPGKVSGDRVIQRRIPSYTVAVESERSEIMIAHKSRKGII